MVCFRKNKQIPGLHRFTLRNGMQTDAKVEFVLLAEQPHHRSPGSRIGWTCSSLRVFRYRQNIGTTLPFLTGYDEYQVDQVTFIIIALKSWQDPPHRLLHNLTVLCRRGAN